MRHKVTNAVVESKACVNTATLARVTLGSFLGAAICIMIPSAAYAQIPTPMGAVLCWVLAAIYGNLGRGLCTLAVCVVGVGALLGKTSWGMAITVAVGTSIIAQAGWIAGEMLGAATGAGGVLSIGC